MKLTVTKTYDNWLTLLEELADNTLKLDLDQLLNLKQAAREWPTCACGQLCTNLPRYTSGAPRDVELNSLGGLFYQYVDTERFNEALRTFKKIEKRSTLLVEEQQAEEKRAEEVKRLEAVRNALIAEQALLARKTAAPKRPTPSSFYTAPADKAYPFNYSSQY